LQHNIRCTNTILTRKYEGKKNVRCGRKQEFGAEEECVGLKERKNEAERRRFPCRCTSTVTE